MNPTGSLSQHGPYGAGGPRRCYQPSVDGKVPHTPRTCATMAGLSIRRSMSLSTCRDCSRIRRTTARFRCPQGPCRCSCRHCHHTTTLKVGPTISLLFISDARLSWKSCELAVGSHTDLAANASAANRRPQDQVQPGLQGQCTKPS